MSKLIKAIQSVKIPPNTTLESIYEEKIAFFGYQSTEFIQYLKLELEWMIKYSKQLAPIMEVSDLQMFTVMSGNLEWELKELEHQAQLPYLLKKWCESESTELDSNVFALLKIHFDGGKVTKKQILEFERKKEELVTLSKKAVPKMDEVMQRCLINATIEIDYLLGKSEVLTKRGKRLIEA